MSSGPRSSRLLAVLVLLAGSLATGASAAPVADDGACTPGAPIRRYDIAAVAVDLPLNRWGDHDPAGRAYVLQRDVGRVRAEEDLAAQARRSGAPVPVSLGLQSDVLQPLTLRVLPGECLRLVLRNDVPGEAVSLHLHGAGLRLAGGGPAAVPGVEAAVAAAGSTVSYDWAVPAGAAEGTHYFHSMPTDAALGRQQTAHGLYGAVVVEPLGSRWLDPLSGAGATTGWAAVVAPPGRPAFREFVLYYAEVGDETFQPLDRRGVPLPQAESLSGSYRPAARAVNYRSEPFYDRLLYTQQRGGRVDDSLAYSSYSYGDPATPMLRSYLGDPVKQRVVNAGTETAHVHHVHGGATRWRRAGSAETGATGLTKRPELLPGRSERTDSQTLGPSETVDLQDECGAGGCQQSVGDFLYHCHVAQHYFAGMWGLWRVYNTLQDGPHSTDSLPPLPALPDRGGRVLPGVDSGQLVGTVLQSSAELPGWLADRLPPPGRPAGDDASVWDWRRQGLVVVGEPEDATRWPGYASPTPGIRPPVLFEPRTGKPAYPMLRPHLGRRPPFAPGHGPAPYLDPSGGPDPPAPGASGPESTCPSGTRLRRLPIKAVELPVPLDAARGRVDPDGRLFVLQGQEAAARADASRRQPLTVRANAGQDCLDLTLVNGMSDAAAPNGFSKVSLHVHFMQFDVQGSDGVVGGFNYEQTVRPYAAAGARLAAAAPAGARQITVAGPVPVGSLLGVGLDRSDGFEVVRVVSRRGRSVGLGRPLRQAHAAGEVASPEFVRYRWYPDVQVGTAFFHDHVNAILGQPHGLFGALVVEPPGSTFTDPVSGRPVDSGPLADVISSRPTSRDVGGSFRELVTYLADDVPITGVGRDSGGHLNLRTEPLATRPDPAAPFRGPVGTPLLSAYAGDAVVFRTLVGASNEVHTFHVDGHGFRVEPWSVTSPLTATVPLGISERYDLSVRAGGPRAQPGDYLFGNGRLGKLESGSWSVLRVLPGPPTDALRPLPGRAPAAPAPPVCPASAPVVTAAVSAVPAVLPALGGTTGLAFVRTGRSPARPLVLHVRSGDCLQLAFTNRTDRPLSPRSDLLPQEAADGAVGANADRSTPPGGTRTYRLYADPSLGATVAVVRDSVDPVGTLRRGLYAAVVVDPRASRRTDGGDGVSAVVRTPDGRSYRDFTVFLQDGDGSIGTHRMPYTRTVDGVAAVSYGSSAAGSRTPPPLLEAYAGEPVRLHVVVPASEQTQVFTVDGHSWSREPGSPAVSSTTVGGLQALTLQLTGGAGGPARLPGDYRYGNARLPYDVAGMWGVLRVHPRGARTALAPLPGGPRDPGPVAIAAVGAAAAVLLVLVVRLIAVGRGRLAGRGAAAGR